MKRILLLTGAENTTKKTSDPDNKVEEMFNLTLPSKQRYVKKHGYDLFVLRSFGSDYKNKLNRTDNHIGFLRVLRSIEMLEYYDIVMWIDGDSIITNNNYSIEDFNLTDKTVFSASWDWMHKTPYFNGHYFHAFSLGNFILQKNEYTETFVNTFYSIAKHFPEEQYTINTIYAGTSLKENIQILDHKFLGGVPSFIETDIWKNKSKIIDPWTPEHFLSHFTGISNEQRIDMMKTKFSDYL